MDESKVSPRIRKGVEIGKSYIIIFGYHFRDQPGDFPLMSLLFSPNLMSLRLKSLSNAMLMNNSISNLLLKVFDFINRYKNNFGKVGCK